jgi:S-ribosylhomocysteine lyase LuxS involved in autoinducer biosynthesis
MFVNIHLFVPRNKDVVGREAMFSVEHLFSETLKKSKSTKSSPAVAALHVVCVGTTKRTLALRVTHISTT